MVQCAALVETNHGIVNLIMNEYTCYGKGHTIHSSGQIEWFKNSVDDRSVQVGGKQRICTIDGYTMPLLCKDNGPRVETINFILDISNGNNEELISYNQLLEHLENAKDHDMGMDQELYRLRAIIGHQGPLLASVTNCKRKQL